MANDDNNYEGEYESYSEQVESVDIPAEEKKGLFGLPRLYSILIAAAAGAAALAGLICLTIFLLVPLGKYSYAGVKASNGDYAKAYETYDRLDGFLKSEEKKAALASKVATARQQDVVTFADMEWLVLEEKGNKALLLLKDCLEERPYNDTLTNTTWAECSLREYLNGKFYSMIPEEDRAKIQLTTLDNSNNPTYKTDGGKKTQDYIFCLSVFEAGVYFTTDTAREAKLGSRNAYWWLRTTGMDPILAANVSDAGTIGEAGSGVNWSGRAVRPAMWVKF